MTQSPQVPTLVATLPQLDVGFQMQIVQMLMIPWNLFLDKTLIPQTPIPLPPPMHLPPLLPPPSRSDPNSPPSVGQPILHSLSLALFPLNSSGNKMLKPASFLKMLALMMVDMTLVIRVLPLNQSISKKVSTVVQAIRT